MSAPNILTATVRPAMAGIFSSASDQLAALTQFVRDAAVSGKTIEWGKIDLSVDVEKMIGDERGLVVPSGSHWVLHPEFVLRARAASNPKYEILRLHDKVDVVIEGAGARIIGERAQHKSTAGEWGMGVSIRGCANIRISDLHVENCWGDGWYIGATVKKNHSQDVHLERISSDYARRNGLSLISARGFVCIDGRFTNTRGTAPEWGIDLEPNYRSDFLEDVTFVRPRTERNASAGIGLYLHALSGTRNPVSIRFIDPVDTGSAQGFLGAHAANIPGIVEFLDPVSREAHYNAIAFRNWRTSGPQLRVVRPSCVDWNRAKNQSRTLSAAILIHATQKDPGQDALGNIEITEPDLMLNSGSAVSSIAVSDLRSTAAALPARIAIRDPIDLAGLPVSFGKAADIQFTDRHRKSVTRLADGSQTLGPATFFMHNITPNLTRKSTYYINENHGVGTELVLEIGGSGGPARFRFPPGVRLSPDTLGPNRLITSSAKGARLQIRKVSEREWRVIKKVGTWTGM